MSLLQALALLLLLRVCVCGARDPARPNFVIIMADDLGIGDLGCYGNSTLRWVRVGTHACANVGTEYGNDTLAWEHRCLFAHSHTQT